MPERGGNSRSILASRRRFIRASLCCPTGKCSVPGRAAATQMQTATCSTPRPASGRFRWLFTLYFLALLVQALIELRLAMKRECIAQLPIYPEQRPRRRPTTEQILRLFSLAERHTLVSNARAVQVFNPRLTDLQRQVLTPCLAFPNKRIGRHDSGEIRAKLRPRCAECRPRVPCTTRFNGRVCPSISKVVTGDCLNFDDC